MRARAGGGVPVRALRIGAGAGFSGDRIEPAVELAERAGLDYLVFECLAERTVALAQLERARDPSRGFDPLLERRMRAVLPAARANGTRVLTNMGAANPAAAAERVREVARELGLGGLRVAAVEGDDVLDAVAGTDATLEIAGVPVASLGGRLISANAYTGAGPLVEALAAGADVVVAGRASDPALFLAPLVHELGWAMDDWAALGRGTLVGHLLECAAQVSGGYFADPGFSDVPGLADLGFPFAEVEPGGDATITKLPGTGGLVTRATCTEQLLYEIHDPARYLQPDVVADFSGVELVEVGPDRVRVSGATGHPRTGSFKVSIGYTDGWIGEGQISYAGPGAEARGRLAIEVVERRLERLGAAVSEIDATLVGVDALAGGARAAGTAPREVRVRVAARCADDGTAALVADEVESLYLNGPAGGGGVARSVREVVAIDSALVPASAVRCAVDVREA